LLRNLERGFDLGFVKLPAVFGASQIALGLIFILVMVLRPQGLFGDKEITFIVSGSDQGEPRVKQKDSA
jgi:branched-chain amino acid transport system permease protein